jgi:hypothetical protein
MNITVNSVVDKMNGYLPFDSNHSSIYEEYQTSGDTIDIQTLALSYLANLYEGIASVVILTGDAGHGKTYLCRKFLQELGYTEDEARRLILGSCDGSSFIENQANKQKRPVKIFKDLSELSETDAVAGLENALIASDTFTLICVNEGKLRAVLSAAADSSSCTTIKEELSSHFEKGVTSLEGKTHIINLNFQSVAAQGSMDGSLMYQTLKSWMDGRKWGSCTNCAAKSSCPIFHNFTLLSEARSPKADTRLERIVQLLAVAEQLGEVVTIREMLMLVSYFVTGGLSCQFVHKNKKNVGWQNEYAFYNLLFKTPSALSREALKSIFILDKLRVLDPGLVSDRQIDEELLNSLNIFEENQLDLQFYSAESTRVLVDAANGVDEIIGNPINKKERQREADLTMKIVRTLRRRAYFEAIFDNVGATKQLGFEHGSQFNALLSNSMKGTELSRVKRRVISGLHTIQGIVGKTSITNLLLVDPAFGSSTQHAAIISRTIQPSEIKLIPMRNKWEIENTENINPISSSVDWIDRYICLRIQDVTGRNRDFPLDLLTFNTICVAADGFISEGFFTHDLRRIKNFLARLCESDPTKQSDIRVIVDGTIQSVSIDDGVIQVGGSS